MDTSSESGPLSPGKGKQFQLSMKKMGNGSSSGKSAFKMPKFSFKKAESGENPEREQMNGTGDGSSVANHDDDGYPEVRNAMENGNAKDEKGITSISTNPVSKDTRRTDEIVKALKRELMPSNEQSTNERIALAPKTSSTTVPSGPTNNTEYADNAFDRKKKEILETNEKILSMADKVDTNNRSFASRCDDIKITLQEQEEKLLELHVNLVKLANTTMLRNNPVVWHELEGRQKRIDDLLSKMYGNEE